MIVIIHRINKIKELKKIPKKYGVEIDIRSSNKKLILSHDPHKKGDDFKKYLKNYNHSLLVANIKEAGIESQVIKEIKKANIKFFFLLDVEFPYLWKAKKSGFKNIAVRFSEEEPIQTVKNCINKIKYVWIDTFTKLPINKKNHSILKKFHQSLVSPDRWNRAKDIHKYKKYLKKNNIKIDSVMTSKKYVKDWEK